MLVSLVIASSGCGRQEEPEDQPGVIILFADDMGYGDLECYGHPNIRTPNLNRMAARGIRLTSFYAAAPVCSPSRAGLLTGRYPVRCGMPHNTGPGSDNHLPVSEITIAQALKKAGYRTMAIGKWHLGHSRDEYMPTSRGFDRFFGLPYSNDMIKPWVQTDRPLRLFKDLEPIEDTVDQRSLTVRYTRQAQEFIRSSKGRPFFIYLAYSMPHLPVNTSDGFRGNSVAGLYGDVIQTIDWSAGQIMQTLEEEGAEDNTLLVFTSDNGPWHNLPPRMLQGGNEPWHAGSAGLLKGSKGTTYEGGMREPCIIRWPAKIPAGQVSSEPASTLDLFPTILTAAGVDLPGDRTIDGDNILPMLRGPGPSPARYFFYGRGTRLEAVRNGHWKYRISHYVIGDQPDGPGPFPELYNLDLDPAEMYNVADRYPDVAEEMDRVLRVMAEELQATVAD